MKAAVRLFGHPVHQMMIVLPMGLFAGAVIFDILDRITSSTRWADVSFWMIAVGVISGLFAAVFGIADWIRIPQGTRAKRIGIVHGVGNVVVVALFAISWMLRYSDPQHPRIIALVFSFLGGGLALVTGWLGGELVNRLGVGVDEGANLNAPNSLSRRNANSPLLGPSRREVPGRQFGVEEPADTDLTDQAVTKRSGSPRQATNTPPLTPP